MISKPAISVNYTEMTYSDYIVYNIKPYTLSPLTNYTVGARGMFKN